MNLNCEFTCTACSPTVIVAKEKIHRDNQISFYT